MGAESPLQEMPPERWHHKHHFYTTRMLLSIVLLAPEVEFVTEVTKSTRVNFLAQIKITGGRLYLGTTKLTKHPPFSIFCQKCRNLCVFIG